MPTYLKDLPIVDPDRNLGDRQKSRAEYIALPEVARLEWPAAVVGEWLFDHGDHEAFRQDYATLDLSGIDWTLEEVPLSELQAIRTGASEQVFLDDVAEDHVHWLSVRPADVRQTWETRGTWMVAPILVAQNLLSLPGCGLQVIEGRMRVGILQGRRRDGLYVADSHEAWVGRALLDLA